ncbi:sensor histidine kinase [Hyalangium gracile]|uniref:sensor histidine kinase n=1 Tax=Hyalangium gracile TaxID=394092 RepID=UPI001CCAF890|nr:PAS domain-containing protein [Hyalangium gracile]
MDSTEGSLSLMSPCDPASEGLADFLQARSQAIAQRWEERVRLQSTPALQGGLLEALPRLLDALGAALRGEPVATGSTVPASVGTLAQSHGRECFHRGFAIAAVVREYSVLRDVILDVLREGACLLDTDALRRLLDVLSHAGAEALRCYALEHEQALRDGQDGPRELAERLRAEAELRQSETRYRLAILATSDAVWDLDLSTHQVHWSDNVHRLTGRAPGEVEMALDWWADNIHPEDRERVVNSLQAVVDTGGNHWMEEYRFRRGDGSYMFVNDRGYVVRDAQGHAVRMVGAFQDITERKVAEHEAQRRADFEQHLIGIVSHDLRNPLNAISMAARLLLKKGGLDESQRQSVQRIVTSAERATRMLRDLLDFTQARLSGSIPVEFRPMDLHELTRLVVEEVQLAHPHRRLVVERTADGQGAWDADRLAQLITNLVNNALTYGDEHCAVRVRTHGWRDSVVLSVHNMGAPIPPELIGQLFQPLKRGEDPGSRGSHSIGLGLFIVKHITEAHAGHIRVDSSLENGTTFTVTLPRRPPGAPEPARS